MTDQARDAALAALVARVPYIAFLGIRFDRCGDELTARMPFQPRLIGNPVLPALHGGATAAFLEVAAIVSLGWQGIIDTDGSDEGMLRLPKTISFTIDYLRTGQSRDAFARARVTRQGRRFAAVHVEGWQDERLKPFAQGHGQFLMPGPAQK